MPQARKDESKSALVFCFRIEMNYWTVTCIVKGNDI